MSDARSFLGAHDPRWATDTCRHLIEITSTSNDNDLAGIGSSPITGDLGQTGIRVPAAATTGQNNRYLFRLCGIEIPSGKSMIIRGLRQLATIRAERTQNTDEIIVVEREIVSPLWHFLDGNISWHLRYQKNQFASMGDPAAANPTPGTSSRMRGLMTALLYRTTIVPYTALNGGVPPGVGIDDLGTWRDMRFPWNFSEWTMSTVVRGPGAIVLYASVRQTDPDRATMPDYPDTDGMRPEDRFVSNFPEAIYGRIAGSMTVEILPCCEEGPVTP